MEEVKKYAITNYNHLNLQSILIQLRKNWYWFGLSVFVCLGISVYYLKYSQKQFQVYSTILVQKQPTLEAFTPLTRNIGWNITSNKKNQAGILGSYQLQLKTLQDLKWNISWFKKTPFSKIDVYKASPYGIIENVLQTNNIPVTVKFISIAEYEISCNEMINNNGVKQKIKFNEKGTFGQRFKNPFFDITIQILQPKLIETGEEYIFIFNDFNQLSAEYQTDLQIKFSDEESDLIDIQFSTSDSLRGVDYLNKLLDNYVQNELEEKNRIANNTIRFINRQISGITDSLKEAEQNFTNFRARNKIVSLDEQASTVLQNVQEIQKQETSLRNKLEYYNNLKKYLTNVNEFRTLVVPSVIGITDPTFNSQVAQLSDLYNRREVLSHTAQQSNPSLISLNNEIDYTRFKLGENINNLISNSQIDLNNLLNQKQTIDSELSKLPRKEQNFIDIKRSRDINNELYTFLLQRRAEAGIALASNNSDIRIIDSATTATATLMGPKSPVILLISFLIGTLIPLATLILANLLSKKLKSLDQIKEKLGFAITGVINTNSFKNAIPVLNYPSSEVTESFRKLRTNIEYLLKNQANSVIAVQSAIVNEGKTFVSVNLAASLGISNRKVLLVETDIRKPMFDKLFQLKNSLGFWDYFINKNIEVNKLSMKTLIPGLSIILAGSAATYSSDLLTLQNFTRFITNAKMDYDYIIIDNAPMEIISYPKIIAQKVDINLFLLRLNFSTQEQFDYISQLQQEDIIKNLTLCVNDVNFYGGITKHKGYGYYRNEGPGNS